MITKEYIIYLRKSSESKKKQEQSIPDQLEACWNYAKSNNLIIKKKPINFEQFETEKDIQYENNLKDPSERKIFQQTREYFIVKESFS